MSNPTPIDGPGLLLHLSGPLQSYGTNSRFPSVRETATHPTRSALIGMIAAALGIPRHDADALAELRRLRFAIRVDRPGTILRDFHTVGGGQTTNTRTITTAEGKRRELSKATMVTERYYLTDAAFTVAVTAPATALLRTCAAALDTPHWPTYLGRRACPPDLPVLLTETDHPLKALTELPLHLDTQAPDSELLIGFIADHPLDQLPVPASAGTDEPERGALPAYTLPAEPASFDPDARAHTAVTYYRRRARMPRTLRGGLGTDYLETLTHHLGRHAKDPAHA